jgi:hypothetical protein
MTKHTDGPWEDREVGQNWIEILGKPDEYKSRLILGTVLPTQYESLGKSDEQKANARLMAAAPDLLEACKEIHKLWCCPPPKRIKDWSARCDVMADYARQAIAKAQGRKAGEGEI